MSPAGLAKVGQAKRDGSWSALDAVEALEIPADLSAAFTLHPSSAENFEAFPRSTKRGILEWINQAKRRRHAKANFGDGRIGGPECARQSMAAVRHASEPARFI